MNHFKTALAAVAIAGLLSACGGGNDDNNSPPGGTPPPPSATGDVPTSALATPESFTDYVGSLQLSDTGMPLNVTGANPPTTETGLPKAL